MAATEKPPKESLGAARTHIFSAAEEVKAVRHALAHAREHVSLETAAVVTQAVRHTRQQQQQGSAAEGSSCTEAPQLAEFERRLRHAEVELEEQRVKTLRLQEDNDALTNSKADLEADMRSLRRELDLAIVELKHRDVDDKLRGKREQSAPRSLSLQAPQSSDPSAMALEDLSDDPVLRASAALEHLSMLHCNGPMMSKKQAIAGLSALQGQLQVERSKRAALEGRMRKDRERLSGLFDLAARQREELQFLRQRLHEQLVESQHWGSVQSLPNEWSKPRPRVISGLSGHSPTLSGHSSDIARHASTTKLPVVS